MSALRNRAKTLLRRAASMSNAVDAAVATTVTEITSCSPRPMAGMGPRLNILLPSINAQHYFGGIHTAVQLYLAMYERFARSRIILIDSAPDAAATTRFPDHQAISADEESEASRQIVAFNDRYGRTLPVHGEDHWLVTSWWTAYAAQRMSHWQEKQFGTAGKLAYLIQDFEPGFYPWSSRYAMALSTYRPSRDVAIFNTGLLADFFQQQGLDYERKSVFEPTLNNALRGALEKARAMPVAREKRIVVYGRPSTPRNAFELLCEGLRSWGWSDPHSSEWEVVAPGELVHDLDIGPFKLRALGKLGIDEYGALLSSSAIGVSMMVSPHPSYPPLEMAAFGMGVVSNRFADKDLAHWSPAIRSIETFTPEAIADSLARESARWRESEMRPYPILAEDHAFLGTAGMEPVAGRLLQLLGMGQEAGR